VAVWTVHVGGKEGREGDPIAWHDTWRCGGIRCDAMGERVAGNSLAWRRQSPVGRIGEVVLGGGPVGGPAARPLL
jgi:hypothetical protein